MPLGAELFIYSPELAQDRTKCAYGCQRLTLQSVRAGGTALAAPSPGALGPGVPPPSSARQCLLRAATPLPAAAPRPTTCKSNQPHPFSHAAP